MTTFTEDFTIASESVAIPKQDATPPVDDYSIEAEDAATPEAPYGYTKSGRIRKRPIGSTTRGSGSRATGSNKVLAEQAAALLAQTNGLLCTGMMVVGMRETASALANANDGFEEQVAAALVTDPALCRTILKAGGTSAKMSLLIAYAMLAGSVAPIGVMEFKAMRAARADAEDN